MSHTRVIRLAAGAALALTALSVPALPATAGSGAVPTDVSVCRVTALPVPDGTWRSDVTAGDSTGRYLVGDAGVFLDGVTGLQPLLWVNGRLRNVPLAYPDPVFVDVNSSGAVVGRFQDGSHPVGFVYHNGIAATLPGLHPASGSYPLYIDNLGDILGYSVESEFDWRIAYWPAHRLTAPREVVAPVPINPAGLDDNGVALLSTAGAESAVTYLWSADGTVRQVRGPSGGTDFYAVAIRNGWIAGTDEVSTSGVTVAWHPVGRLLNRAPGLGSPYAVNGRGDLGGQGAVDRRHGGLVLVPDLGGGASGVNVLSDFGLAAGFASDAAYQAHAVIWTGC